MGTISNMVICSRADACENKKCDHISLHEVKAEQLDGKSICFHETCGGKPTICQPVKPTWEA